MNPAHDDELDQWLQHEHRRLLDALDTVLDLDAGLADATLTTHTVTHVDALDTLLDLDAGLAAILPSTTNTDTTRPAPQPAGHDTLTAWAEDFARLPAHHRLTTRTHSPLPHLTTLHTVLHAAATQQLNAPTRDRDHALAHTRARDYDLDRALALAYALARARDRARDLDRALTYVLARDLDLAHTHALDLTRDLDRARDLALALDRALALDFAHTRELDLTRDRALALTHTLARAHGSGGVELQELEKTTAELKTLVGATLTTALKTAVVRARHVSTKLAGTNLRLAAAVNTADADDAERAIWVLETALSDAVDADLSDTDLDDVPLEGVLWSSGTRWPPHLADHMHDISEQVAPDRWRITSPPPQQVDHHATT